LIALPGGFNTSYPIIFYTNQDFYDVGHVAVLTLNSSQVPSTINNDETFKMSISTNSTENMHEESLKKNWTSEHGVAFVGQVFDVNWVWFYHHWYDFGFKRVATDVNNDNIYNKVVPLIGKPYCNIFQLLTAKWAAPGHFICSSTAWWCAEQGCNVDIGDWWKPTIFPAGVYLSDRVRIIDNTLN
jgi:hypothetical protein